MKKYLLQSLIALMMMLPNCGWAQQTTANEFNGIKSTPGYAIIKNINAQRYKNRKSSLDMVIKAGRLCTMYENNGKQKYSFMLIDCAEELVVGKDMVVYYEPNQDTAPARYIKKTVFNQSVKKVKVYEAAPSSWKKDVEVTLTPQRKSEYYSKIVVKPIVIKDKNAVFVDGYGNESNVKRLSLYNKTVYKITQYGLEDEVIGSYYSYKGEQIMKYNLDSKGEFLEDFAAELKIDDNGFCYAKGYEESDTFKPCSELSTIVGEYPSIGLVGWISATEMVVDDIIYVVK